MAALDAPPPALSPGMLSGMADDTLVGLIAAGSDDAVTALDARYRRRLVRFARGFVSGSADADDAVQEAMMRAIRALRNGSRPEAVGPWLHRIARNCALDLSAARRRHPVVELADHAHPAAEDALEAVERSMGVRGLVADVGQLPQTQRSALVLRELEGRSYADIADELDTTVPAVKSLLVRARRGLKRARDDRRVAAWLPLPLLSRFGERLVAAWEPVAATASPKVATMAVVLAGSAPVLSGPAASIVHPPAKASAATATPKAQEPPAIAAATPSSGDERPGGGAAAPRTIRSVAMTTTFASAGALPEDCRDGTIDGTYRATVLRRALTGSPQGEYTDCSRALAQAIL